MASTLLSILRVEEEWGPGLGYTGTKRVTAVAYFRQHSMPSCSNTVECEHLLSFVLSSTALPIARILARQRKIIARGHKATHALPL